MYWFSVSNERMGIWVGIIGEHTVECLSAVHEYMSMRMERDHFPGRKRILSIRFRHGVVRPVCFARAHTLL